MHAYAGRQFVPFLWWSLVWPGREANSRPTVWEADTLPTEPTRHGKKVALCAQDRVNITHASVKMISYWHITGLPLTASFSHVLIIVICWFCKWTYGLQCLLLLYTEFKYWRYKVNQRRTVCLTSLSLQHYIQPLLKDFHFANRRFERWILRQAGSVCFHVRVFREQTVHGNTPSMENHCNPHKYHKINLCRRISIKPTIQVT